MVGRLILSLFFQFNDSLSLSLYPQTMRGNLVLQCLYGTKRRFQHFIHERILYRRSLVLTKNLLRSFNEVPSPHGRRDMWSGSLLVDALAIVSLGLFAMMTVLPLFISYDQPKS